MIGEIRFPISDYYSDAMQHAMSVHLVNSFIRYVKVQCKAGAVLTENIYIAIRKRIS